MLDHTPTPSPQQTKEIPLTRGQVAIVDADDFDMLNQYKWCAYKSRRTWYAQRNVPRGVGKQTSVKMHNVIMGAKGIDHRDGNGLNNTRANLRLANNQQNTFNMKPRVGSASAYKGVTWSKRHKKWRARIGFNDKLTHLGYFDDETEAALAYDLKARELFGEFACLNCPTIAAAHSRLV